VRIKIKKALSAHEQKAICYRKKALVALPYNDSN
jgi:hypothetical protein